MELILDAQAAGVAEVLRPLLVDFALEVERVVLVREVAGGDQERERDPKEKRVDREEALFKAGLARNAARRDRALPDCS